MEETTETSEHGTRRGPVDARGPGPRVRTIGRLAWFALIAITSGITVYVLQRFHPSDMVWMPFCPFHRFTGLFCPGCGATRAIHHLLNGEFLAGLRMNPLLVLSLPFLVYLVVREYVVPALTGRAPRPIAPAVAWVVFVVVVCYWIARNVPVYPFTLLAPPG